MGVATGCGCKDFLILLIPTPLQSCICTFLQQHPYFFCSLKKMFFVLVPVLFLNYILGIN